ncbi:MAG TPA: biotin/lipoyl-binding protein, partial [Acidobacteriota bacterium]|nr:biotin/lipoyl-binding protein [Acidobacteriota bacterium]
MSETKKDSKKVARNIGILVLLLGVIFVGGWRLRPKSKTQPGVIPVSGRIESDTASIAAKVSGRIREISVREGDQVKAGQVIAILDDEQVKARELQAQSMVAQADAKLLEAQQQVAVLQAEREQSRLGVSQASVDAEGRISQAQSLLAAAEANLAEAQASYQQALYDEGKLTALVETGDVPEREGKQATTTTLTKKAVVDAATKQVEAARGALQAAKANLENPRIRAAQ